MGLQAAFLNDLGTHALLKKMMALPYLPEDELGPMLRQLERDASTPELTNLAQYMKSTWIDETRNWAP